MDTQSLLSQKESDRNVTRVLRLGLCIRSTCLHMYHIQRHRIDSHESSRWSRKTPGHGHGITLTCPTRVQLLRTRSSRCKKFHRSVRFQESCFRRHRTSYVSASSVQLWLLACASGFGHTLVLVLASTSGILSSIDLCIGQDSMSNRVGQHPDAVVILSSLLPIGNPTCSLPFALVSSTMYTLCPRPVSISGYARMKGFGRSSSSSSYRQPSECRCNTIEDPCRVLQHCP